MSAGAAGNEAVLAAWPRTRGHRFLRTYADRVNADLVCNWLPTGRVDRLLKTDLFEEAVGAGLEPLLRTRAHQVHGIDRAPDVLAAASARHGDLKTHRADVRDLPFAAASFGAAVSTSTLDHFETFDQAATALRELRRVLVPGGVLVLTLDNRANPLVALRNALPADLLRRLRVVPHRVGATCGPGRLRHHLRAAGFEVDEIAGVMHVPRVLALFLAVFVPSPALLRAVRRPVADTLPHRAVHRRTRTTRMIRRLASAALGRAFYRRLWLFVLDLDEAPQTSAAGELDCGFLGSTDLPAYTRFRPGSEAIALERFRRGDRCFVVRDDGQVVFGRWVARSSAPIEYLGLTLPLQPDEAYAYDGYTDPTRRGHGLATAATGSLGNLLAAEGTRRLLSSAWPENRAALRWHEKAGERRVATVGCLRLGPWRRHFVRPAR